MNPRSCPQEEAVLKAARAGALPESIVSHTSSCAVCRETLQAWNWMQSLVRGDEQSAALPEAKLIWWNAQLDRSKAEKTRTVLRVLEIVSGAAVPVAVAGWVSWNWYGIEGSATHLLAGHLQFPEGQYVLASLTPALLFLFAILLVYPLLVGD